jgi:hypothetical protein
VFWKKSETPGEAVARKLSKDEWDATGAHHDAEDYADTLAEIARLERRSKATDLTAILKETWTREALGMEAVIPIKKPPKPPDASAFVKAMEIEMKAAADDMRRDLWKLHPPEGYGSPGREHRIRYPVHRPRHRASIFAKDTLPPPMTSFEDHELIYVEGEREVRLITPEGDFRIPISALQQVLMNELLEALGE